MQKNRYGFCCYSLINIVAEVGIILPDLRFFILVIVFAAGFLSGILMSLPSLLRKSSALREQRKKVKKLEGAMKMSEPLQPRESDSQLPPP